MRRIINSFFKDIHRAYENPRKIKPYIENRLETLPPHTHDYFYQLYYQSQLDQLNLFRQNDEWALIVLDACRYDRFKQLAPEYLDVRMKPVAAAAEDTFGYLRKCWSNQYEVDYVTGAAPVTTQKFDFSDETLQADGLVFEGQQLNKMYQGYVPSEHISNIIEVWREAWDENLGVCPPEPVTDRAIASVPHSDRLVVHYFQPHEPYIGDTKLLGNIESIDNHLEGGAIGRGIWERVRSGEITEEYLNQAYDDNLKRVLREVALLIDNIEYKFDNIVVMGDHGEALGEYGQYTHSLRHPYVRKVPWAVIKDVNPNAIPSRNIEENPTDDRDNSSVEERLEDLGYI